MASSAALGGAALGGGPGTSPAFSGFIDEGKNRMEAYFEYQLRKEKLAAALQTQPEDAGKKWLSDDEVKALQTMGEKEKLELKILARLSGLADSSPELLQVKTLTNCKSREECAQELAEIYYRKYTTEEVINRFVAPTESKANILAASREQSSKNYTLWGTR